MFSASPSSHGSMAVVFPHLSQLPTNLSAIHDCFENIMTPYEPLQVLPPKRLVSNAALGLRHSVRFSLVVNATVTLPLTCVPPSMTAEIVLEDLETLPRTPFCMEPRRLEPRVGTYAFGAGEFGSFLRHGPGTLRSSNRRAVIGLKLYFQSLRATVGNLPYYGCSWLVFLDKCMKRRSNMIL